MKKILIIGAGNLGSRHLQALKKVNIPLEIFVVDPNQDSLSIAKERYNSISKSHYKHSINYYSKIEKFGDYIDIAIIATNSNIRRSVIEYLLELNNVKYFVLEKILFQKKQDYYSIKEILQKRNSKAWVNCPMVMMPLYEKVRNLVNNKPFNFFLTGSRYGLISNIIHFVDFMVYLIKNTNFTVDTSYLNPFVIPSKRKGYLELSGTLQIHFDNGSHGSFTCYPAGELPVLTEFVSDTFRFIFLESEGKAWLWDSRKKNGWHSMEAKNDFQSDLTTILVEEILKYGTCLLTPYEKSMQIHLTIYESILEFLNKKSGKKYSHYPFT